MKKYRMSRPEPNEFLGQEGFASFAEPENRSERGGRQPAVWSASEEGAKSAADFMEKCLNGTFRR